MGQINLSHEALPAVLEFHPQEELYFFAQFEHYMYGIAGKRV